jgi:hypothetical protein
MKTIDEILSAEEAKWRSKPYEEIEAILGVVQHYELDDPGYEIEVHSQRGKKHGEIVVMVECSKKRFGSRAGKAKYFVACRETGARDVEPDEPF